MVLLKKKDAKEGEGLQLIAGPPPHPLDISVKAVLILGQLFDS